jgi:DNA topoisomerase-1
VARLKRVDCSQPGITRRRRGRGFEYIEADGTRVASEEALARIRELAIPPAWTEVWICRAPNGHLQATGIDAAGRKRYLYHPPWRERRDQQKFEKVLDFARTLAAPAQGDPQGPRERGARSPAGARPGTVRFDYVAKSGQRRVQEINDPDVLRIVPKLKRRRGGGEELLAYREGRKWVDLTSADINQYVKEATGGDFSAKDFRTWNGTMLAAVALSIDVRASGSEKPTCGPFQGP